MSYIGNGPNTTLKQESVTSVELADNSVEQAELATGAVTTPKLADGAITSIKIVDASVTTTKIADGAVTAAKMAGGSVVNSVNGATGAVTGIQPTLVSGTTIKTLGGASLLGSGDIEISTGLAQAQDIKRSITANTATTSIDLQLGDFATFFKVTIAASTTITFTNFPAAPGGEVFTFSMMTANDATAGRTVAFGNTVKWSGGILPTRTTTANAIDVWTFFYENSILYGSLSVLDAK